MLLQSVGTGVEQAKQAAHKGYVTMVGAAEVVGDSLKKSPQVVKDFSQVILAMKQLRSLLLAYGTWCCWRMLLGCAT